MANRLVIGGSTGGSPENGPRIRVGGRPRMPSLPEAVSGLFMNRGKSITDVHVSWKQNDGITDRMHILDQDDRPIASIRVGPRWSAQQIDEAVTSVLRFLRFKGLITSQMRQNVLDAYEQSPADLKKRIRVDEWGAHEWQIHDRPFRGFGVRVVDRIKGWFGRGR